MEKDVDEVGKVARWVKSKIEELDREVKSCCCFYSSGSEDLNWLSDISTLLVPEFSK